jgi:heme/copper-type cytochrome/quinol oxidase subunit 2
MELTNKKLAIIGAIIVVVVMAIVWVVIATRPQGTSPTTANGNSQNGGAASATAASVTATHLPVPENVVVPNAGATNVPATVAVPQVEAAASQTSGSQYRSFDIMIENGQFVPDTIAVNLGDIVNLELSAVDANYDFTQPDYSLGVPIPQGENVRKEFQANVSGKFVFYCSLCGGPAKGPVGYLIVAGQ